MSEASTKKTFVFQIQKALATCGGIGFFPFGSGTLASIVATFFWIGLRAAGVPLIAIVLLCLIIMIVGTLALIPYEKAVAKHDNSEVVIDEWVGMGISLWVVPNKWPWILAAFLLFRLFDIWKPPGVRYFDENYFGGWGVMLDDVVAGIYAAICLGVAEWLIR